MFDVFQKQLCEAYRTGGKQSLTAATTDLETPVLYYYLDCEPSIVYNGQD